MTANKTDEFLRAEEEAHRLVEVLQSLSQEVQSYKSAHEALGEAAVGVGDLAKRSGAAASQIAEVVEALRVIGTPELLHGHETLTADLAATRQGLLEAVQRDADTTRSSINTEMSQLREDIEVRHSALREALQMDSGNLRADLNSQLGASKSMLTFLRNLAFGGIALLLVAVGLLVWLVVLAVRG